MTINIQPFDELAFNFVSRDAASKVKKLAKERLTMHVRIATFGREPTSSIPYRRADLALASQAPLPDGTLWDAAEDLIDRYYRLVPFACRRVYQDIR